MIKQIPLPLIGDKVMLYRSSGNLGKYKVVLRAITKEQELSIEREYKMKGVAAFIVDDEIIAKANNIISCGEFNPNNKEDIDFIREANLINHENDVYIPKGYDYDNNVIVIDTKVSKLIKNELTRDPVKWFLYKHGLIGKPKRIIIYKEKA